MFGDSITQMSFNQDLGFGMGAALQAHYVRKLDIIDRGFGGYNSEHARVILPQILEAETQTKGKADIKLMTIFFGTNDAVDGFQHVTLEKYLSNMEIVIKDALKEQINLIVIGPGLHDTDLLLQQPDRNEKIVSNARYKKYSDGLKELCETFKVPFLDTWHLFQVESGYTEQEILDEKFDTLSKFLTDGIHYTADAYKLVFKEILKIIDQNYPELAAEKLQMHLPDIFDMDPNDVDNTIFKNVELK